MIIVHGWRKEIFSIFENYLKQGIRQLVSIVYINKLS